MAWNNWRVSIKSLGTVDRADRRSFPYDAWDQTGKKVSDTDPDQNEAPFW